MTTQDDGQRIVTSSGTMLVDPELLSCVADVPVGSLFEPDFWAARGELFRVVEGRGAAWFVLRDGCWALRHYRRGGMAARLSADRYAWAGEHRVRAFAEWRVLAELTRRRLPVPRPVAARYRRAGLTYRCDLITCRIAGARSLSGVLAAGPVTDETWRAVGAAIAQLHAAGADHADLNAHNIMLDARSLVSILDFDRCRLRRPGRWTARNLTRLHRSLLKISRRMPPDRFSEREWDSLLAGYATATV